MGQYYRPISVEKGQSLCSHDYDNGLKLMEHSYVGNNFVKVVEGLISPGGDWHGDRILWGGDYADPEPDTVDENGDGNNLYSLTRDHTIRPDVCETTYRYVINLDTKEYVDIERVPVFDTDDNGEWRIHPLPLLTCEGNGRGGGDYRGDSDLVGKWARNRVVMDNVIPDGFTELIFDLVE